jgi:hypothetical protein
MSEYSGTIFDGTVVTRTIGSRGVYGYAVASVVQLRYQEKNLSILTPTVNNEPGRDRNDNGDGRSERIECECESWDWSRCAAGCAASLCGGYWGVYNANEKEAEEDEGHSH